MGHVSRGFALNGSPPFWISVVFRGFGPGDGQCSLGVPGDMNYRMGKSGQQAEGSKISRDLVIRADGNAAMGSGHLMRCLSLAQAWKEAGGIVTLITGCPSKKLLDRFRCETFSVALLEEMYPNSQDWDKTERVLNEHPDAWVVVDGYHFEQFYYERIKRLGNPLLVIDDMANLKNYHADIVLNQNLNAEFLHYLCETDANLLLGTRYVLLRREFRRFRGWNREIPKTCHNLLVSLGGADPYNETLKVLNALENIETNLNIKVVLGATNPNRESVINCAPVKNPNIDILEAADNMAELMCQADVAITSGGSTTWELCFLGLPSIQIILARNQEEVACELGKKEVTVNLGWYEDVTENDITVALKELIVNAEARKSMSIKGRSIVDGKGAERVVSAMHSFSTMS